MSDPRQKNQMYLAFMLEDGGATPRAGTEGTESFMAKREAESPAEDERLMEVICNRENLWEALKQVQRNQGGPGVDGMTVHQLPDYLKEHWPVLREQLLPGKILRSRQPRPADGNGGPAGEGQTRVATHPGVLERRGDGERVGQSDGRRDAAGRSALASYNLANLPITLEQIVSRERLRPCYGQEWQGRR
jgi:hypothetical protein